MDWLQFADNYRSATDHLVVFLRWFAAPEAGKSWLGSFQTLFTGMSAIAAAYIAYRTVKQQVSAEEKRTDRQAKEEIKGVLEQIMRHARASAWQYERYGWGIVSVLFEPSNKQHNYIRSAVLPEPIAIQSQEWRYVACASPQALGALRDYFLTVDMVYHSVQTLKSLEIDPANPFPYLPHFVRLIEECELSRDTALRIWTILSSQTANPSISTPEPSPLLSPEDRTKLNTLIANTIPAKKPPLPGV